MGSIYHAGQEVTNISISGEGYNIVIETTDSELYGETVTIKQNGTVIGTTTFDNEGHAEYKVSQAGTYIVSVTYEGTESTKEVTVSDASVDINVRLSLSSWLVAGGVDPSDYPTFEDLDEETIRRLMLVHNAVDYIASAKEGDTLMETIIRNMECAKWINLCDYAQDEFEKNEAIKAIMDEVGLYGYGEIAPVGQVPTMTSNTTPSGICFTNKPEGRADYEPWKAFDNNDATYFHGTQQNTAPMWVGYIFTEPKVISEVEINLHIDSNYYSGVKDGKIQASNDTTTGNDGTWVDLATDIDTNPHTKEVWRIKLNNNTAYKAIRIYSTQTYYQNYNVQVFDGLQFYAYEPIGNVPVMTANNAPYGEVSASSTWNSTTQYSAFNAFDGTASKRWLASSSDTSPWIQYKFANPIIVKKVYVSEPVKYGTGTLEVIASNDGINWTSSLGTGVIPASTGGSIYISLDNNIPYLYYRVHYTKVNVITESGYTYTGQLYNIQFYGRELKPLVPTMTSNTTPCGEAIRDSVDGAEASYGAWKAFDGVNNTGTNAWYSANIAGTHYVGYKYNKEFLLKQIFYAGGDYDSTHQYVISGSNDGFTSEETVQSLTLTSSASGKIADISTDKTYKGFKLIKENSSRQIYVRELQFFGMDYSEKEFAQGSTRKTIYDHGVKPSGSLTATKTSNGTYEELPAMLRAKVSGSSTASDYAGFYLSNFDCTNYNLMCAKAGNIAYCSSPDAEGIMDICTSLSPTNSYTVGRSVLRTGNNVFPDLDLSNINSSYIIFVGTMGYQAITREATISEWWVE